MERGQAGELSLSIGSRVKDVRECKAVGEGAVERRSADSWASSHTKCIGSLKRER